MRSVVAAVVMGMLATPAWAGQPPDPASLPPTQALDAPPTVHLFGDWGGALTTLQQMGIGVKIDATTEFAGNVSGGIRRDASFASQVEFGSDVNWERLAGLTGLSTHVIIVNRSGNSASQGFGDTFLPAQEIYGSGGDTAVHLVSAFAEETLYDKRLDFAIGRMNVENDFASSSLYCGFMNNALCGDPKALPGGDIGHSAYPDAVWAARLRVKPTAQTYVQFGVYEVNQALYTYPQLRSGFTFDDSQDSGVYLPVEAAWEPRFGADQLVGHYKLGFGYDTSGTYTDYVHPGPHHTGNTQFWALADQMLVRQGKGDADGLVAMAGVVVNDPSNTAYAHQYFAALVDQGFWKARPNDAVGLLFTYVDVSGPLARAQAQQLALGQPLSNGASGVQSHEMIFEANYKIGVVDGVYFQPDVQYVSRPNAQASLHDAVVLGFRLAANF